MKHRLALVVVLFAVLFAVPLARGSIESETTAVAQDRATNSSDPGHFELIADNAPKLSLVWPSKEDIVGARHALSWHADDSDHDAVGDYALEILGPQEKTRAAEAWRTIAKGIKGTSYEWDAVSTVPSGQYHGMLLVLQEVREFSARSRFSSPVYADEGDYRGTLRRLEKAWVCSREAFGHLLLRNFEDGHAGTALRLEFFPDRLDDLAGHSSS